MRQKFGNVALFMIEVGKDREEIFDNHDFREVKEFEEFQRIHKVSDRMMNLAYAYSKLFLNGDIDTPYEFIEKVSMEEATKTVVKIKGDKMATQEYNTSNLSVDYVDGKFIISGEKVHESAKIRTFLKQNGGQFDKENKVWTVNDFLQNTKKSTLDKRLIANGFLNIMFENEKRFNEAKNLYYEAKKGGDKDEIEARAFVYNVANIVLNDNFSKKARKKYLEESLEKSIQKIDELEKKVAELKGYEQLSPKQEEFLGKLNSQLEALYKSVENHGTRVEHLNTLERDVNKLKELGFMKDIETKSGVVSVIASKDHKAVMSFMVDYQNKLDFKPQKSYMESYLQGKAEEVKSNQEQKQTTQEEKKEEAKQDNPQNETQEEKQTSKRNYRK